MSLFEKLKNLFRKPAPQEKPAEAAKAPTRLQKTCKKCGKTFSYDPSWEFIPNYCKECKKQFAQEKEEKQAKRKADHAKGGDPTSCKLHDAFPSLSVFGWQKMIPLPEGSGKTAGTVISHGDRDVRDTLLAPDKHLRRFFKPVLLHVRRKRITVDLLEDLLDGCGIHQVFF